MKNTINANTMILKDMTTKEVKGLQRLNEGKPYILMDKHCLENGMNVKFSDLLEQSDKYMIMKKDGLKTLVKNLIVMYSKSNGHDVFHCSFTFKFEFYTRKGAS